LRENGFVEGPGFSTEGKGGCWEKPVSPDYCCHRKFVLLKKIIDHCKVCKQKGDWVEPVQLSDGQWNSGEGEKYPQDKNFILKLMLASFTTTFKSSSKGGGGEPKDSTVGNDLQGNIL